MNHTKDTLIIVLGSLIVIALAIWGFSFQDDLADGINSVANPVEIEKKWELPHELNEISGMDWLEPGKVICVQDEAGILFIYDLNENRISEEIEFAKSGDYEGITINKNDAYVLRSDGQLFEIKDFRSNKKINDTNIGFSAKDNMESLVFDHKNNYLLTMPKNVKSSAEFMAIYQIPLDSKKADKTPEIKIPFENKDLKTTKSQKLLKRFSPSDIAIHPKTGDYYILDGKNPKLLILDASGNLQKIRELDRNQFEQPEGITFSPDGTLFISNEAGKNKANILQVNLDN
ncbi:SdiA-regulated domain-containing protein [Galbibacter sp. BG1]|uniref:SdiA-regulated domain-containing protein n=1 Tax=Galbibacter sp. BG1 TaxID=1170699 RepID=UPI0015C0E16B|nr:SdiA-regulated domain-containing protein [Galbibacter sp. BG1]QLE02853.1 SdiA-regulated domain-containing protein [Galbibacter sp. BG1]